MDWIDTKQTGALLRNLFAEHQTALGDFGLRINQVFEAFVVCATMNWYRSRGWEITIVSPIDSKTKQPYQHFKFKFSTRGKPSNYSYAVCRANTGEAVEIRHQLRVSTERDDGQAPSANVCLDVAVIRAEVSGVAFLSSDDPVPNEALVTFGEAKHMSAFAELMAGFIGLVHEMQSNRLKCVRRGNWDTTHPAPFLYVSGHLYRTAEGLERTIKSRKYDVDIYSRLNKLNENFSLPTRPPD